MAEVGKKLGDLSVAILEHFVESKLGEKFVKELREGTDRQVAITGAMQATVDRLWKKWGEENLYLYMAIFNHLPKNKQLLVDLREAIRKLYQHPTDTGFADVLTKILQEHEKLTPEVIQDAVQTYVTVLTEELAMVDDDFREKYRDLLLLRHLEKQAPIASEAFRPGSAPPRPSLMVGRDEDVKALKERLSIPLGGKTPLQVLTAIKGWPGVGKTTIASALAHDPEITKRFPDGILWISLGQDPSVISKMAEWGRAIGNEDILKAKTVEEAQSMLANLLRNKRMLLIIDDAWKAEDARPFMVGGSGCATLVTTRLNDVAGAITPVADNIYNLKVLKDDDALELLRKLAPTVVKAHPSECLVLVQELEGLPLALQVAGRMLNAEVSAGFSVIELIGELREGAKLLAATAPADRADLVTETTPTIAALLYKSLEHLDDASKECYAYLGAFAPKPATFDIGAMSYVWQMEDPKPVIRILVERGLLEFIPEMGRYQMHALMVMLAKTLLTEDE